MTPAEYRRRASQKRAEADGLAADADRLRSQAALLQGLLDALVPMSQRIWVGPAAQDFQSEVRRHGGEINDQARRLVAIAAELDRTASIDRNTAHSLDTQAAAAEAAEAAGAGAPVAGVV